MGDLGFDPKCTPVSNQRDYIDRSWYLGKPAPIEKPPCAWCSTAQQWTTCPVCGQTKE
jgi:hypothetical protein